jgi:hypothetical protein
MVIIHLIMLSAGFVFMGWGLWAVHYRSGWMEKTGAMLAPLGLIITLIAVLLLCVPDFFTLRGW